MCQGKIQPSPNNVNHGHHHAHERDGHRSHDKVAERRLQIDSTTKRGVRSEVEQVERIVRGASQRAAVSPALRLWIALRRLEMKTGGSRHTEVTKNRLVQDVIEQLDVHRGNGPE